jgi:hypothetical protein
VQECNFQFKMRIWKHFENWEATKNLSVYQNNPLYITTIYNTSHFSQCTEVYYYIFIFISDSFQWNVSCSIALKILMLRPFHFSPRVGRWRERERFHTNIVSMVDSVVSVLLCKAKSVILKILKFKNENIWMKTVFLDSTQKIWDTYMIINFIFIHSVQQYGISLWSFIILYVCRASIATFY